ncbi:hypothetical protein KV557_06250 [Kitasatospora aureofaciens]|uniref:hypothetical protein n=1 Tax=Kitasatospora aureofaciens TaxID=1894 RepID=UPI001C463E6A|nr:hypothetical protein [Kitasatospora aureofaciens]MBV6696726.1 hypothetical protein [Kitasatospora aureofaciens]
MKPVFQMFPASGQLRLATQAASGLAPFDVDSTASSWFLRVVAIGPTVPGGPKCEPLGGRAPTIELRAGTGLITAVPGSPDKAAIADETGREVATASWTREPTDVFTVQLDISSPDIRTWRVRITNNDPEELGFVWTSAGTVADAQQPRIVMKTSVQVTVRAGFATEDIPVPVANIGTGTLTFAEQAEADLGAGFVLKNLPNSVAPNACDKLMIGVTPASGPFAAPDQTASHVLLCNDPVDQEKTLQLSRRQEKAGKDHKEKDGKEDKDSLKETGPPEAMLATPPAGGPSAHFISPELRPDLSESALSGEDPGTGQGEG